MKNKLKVGYFGIGLDAYWPQFPQLLPTLLEHIDTVVNKLSIYDIEIVNLGMIDTPEKAFEAGHRFREADIDLLLLHVTTYAVSGTVLPVVLRSKVPVIILNISPKKAIDYKTFNQLGNRTKMTGKWLEYCSACPVPEIANAFKRCGVRFFQITGVLEDDAYLWAELGEWIEAAKVANTMFHNRLGLMGHYYNGMLDIYTDLTAVYATFGGHLEIVELDDLTELRQTVTEEEMLYRVAYFYKVFDVQDDCSMYELQKAAKTSVALDKLVEKYNLNSLAYYYMGNGVPENEDTATSVILGNSLLTARNIPVAGEYEVKNVLAMKILDSFGIGGSFSEYYALDFNDDIVLFGHDGPGHIAIAEGKTKVKPLQVYHGKIGKGLSVEMSVKHGAVTLLSVVEDGKGKFKLLVAEGESVAGPILEIGNTNSRYKFSIGARKFVELWNEQGPAHHCAIGVGHISNKLIKLGKLLELEVVKVC